MSQTLPDLLQCIARAITDESQLDPSELSGRFTIALDALVFYAIGGELLDRLNILAANLRVVLLQWDSGTAHQLVNSEVQLGVNLYPIEVSKELLQRPICSYEYRVLCAEDHPLKEKMLGLDELAKYPFVSLIIPEYSRYQPQMYRLLKRYRVRPKVTARSAQLQPLLDMLLKRELLFPCVNFNKFNELSGFRTLTLDPEIQLPESRSSVFYHYRYRNHPTYLWMEAELAKLLQQNHPESDVGNEKPVKT